MADEQLAEELAAAMTRAFRDYTGTRTGDAMWNLDMEKTFELAAPAALAWLAERGRLVPDGATIEETPR